MSYKKETTREIISIAVGQGGIQLSHTQWKQYKDKE
jgi:hypothetical protein